MVNEKRCKGLQNVDWYAENVSLTFNGRKSFPTRFGGCLSLMLFATVTAYFINGCLNSYTYHNPTVVTVNLP
jgi:hypothetical protein